MRGQVEQRLVLVLPVELDEAGRQLFQGTGGREVPLMKARLRPCDDLAPDQQLFPAAPKIASMAAASSSAPVAFASGERALTQSTSAPVSPVRTFRPVELGLDESITARLDAQEAKHGRTGTPIVT